MIRFDPRRLMMLIKVEGKSWEGLKQFRLVGECEKWQDYNSWQLKTEGCTLMYYQNYYVVSKNEKWYNIQLLIWDFSIVDFWLFVIHDNDDIVILGLVDGFMKSLDSIIDLFNYLPNGLGSDY